MKKLITLMLMLVGLTAAAHAQLGNTLTIPSANVPTGSCAFLQLWNVNTTPHLYYCDASTNTWVELGTTTGGGGGTPGGATSINQLLSGGGVTWTSGLSFSVAPATYLIAGIQYTSPLTTVTLDAADPVNPRVDIIALNTSGTPVVVKGTAATPALAPSIDPTSQLALTSGITLAANGTSPSGVSLTNVYLENTEWTCTASANLNCASTNNPFAGTKDIEATTATAGNNVTLANGSPVTLSSFNQISLRIRSKATWSSQRTLTFYWTLSGKTVGNSVVLSQGNFGFDSSQTSTYQLMVFPISAFGNVSTADTLNVVVTGKGGSTIGFYLDNIILQTGLCNCSSVPTVKLVANGTATLGTGAIGSGACATVVTVSAPGVATTDNLMADFNADPTSTTGYSASATGMLTIIKYPTLDNVNFKVCNNTGGSITPGAATLNWRVVR